MPYLYEMDDARDERPLESPLQETCGTCAALDAGEIFAGGRMVEIGYCRKYGCFVSGSELYEDQRAEGCWEPM